MINKNKKLIIKKKIEKYLKKYKYYYIIDISKFKSNELLIFKKKCYYEKIKLLNIKNTIFKKIISKKKKNNKLLNIIKYNNSLMLSNNINNCANVIINNLININNIKYPIFKVAYIENKYYYNKNNTTLTILCNLKSKKELIIILILNLIYCINNFINNLILYNNIKLINIINSLKYK
ncbi:MAG: hypothetical protein RDO_0530 [Flavobacteriales endosymbiont of Rhyzopertha dominica]|nr:MAG: 50S ribosomal protein L10 [Candidatus Shikimatogenerans bostrichidophilus]